MLSRHQILSWVLSWSFESESGHLPWNQGRSVNTYGPLNFMCSWWTEVKLLSRVQLFAIPWTVANGAPPSMGFSRQEYWSGLPFPSPGNLPTQGLNPGLSHCRQTLYCLSHKGSLPGERIKQVVPSCVTMYQCLAHWRIQDLRSCHCTGLHVTAKWLGNSSAVKGMSHFFSPEGPFSPLKCYECQTK